MIIPYDDITALSLLFHINSEPWQNLEAYQGEGYEVEYKSMAGPGKALALPSPQATPLLLLLQSRESCRQFYPRIMSQATLSTLLAGSYGVSRVSPLPDSLTALFRPVPSAGALYPLELYIAVENVEGIPDGLHHYNVREHSLERLKDKAGADSLRSA